MFLTYTVDIEISIMFLLQCDTLYITKILLQTLKNAKKQKNTLTLLNVNYLAAYINRVKSF